MSDATLDGTVVSSAGLKSSSRKRPLWLFVLPLLALSFLGLFGWIGTPMGHSYVHNLPWFIAFNDGVWSGELWPRFLPGLWWGMGGLDFIFYAPIPFWIASTLGTASCLGQCGPDTAFALGGAWLFILCAPAMYVLARGFLPRNFAILTALIYVILPYKLVGDWFLRQAVGEIAVAIFLPLLVHFLLKLGRGEKAGIGFALSFAAIMLSHLPSALITVLFTAIFATVQSSFFTQKGWVRARRLATIGAFGALGVALAGAYWVPALVLLDTVSPDVLFNPFLNPRMWVFFDGVVEPMMELTTPLKIILISSLAVVAVLVWWSNVDRWLKVLSAVPVVFALWFNSPLAGILWVTEPFQSIQFPYRIFIVSELGLALGLGALVWKASETPSRLKRMAFLAAPLLMGLAAIPLGFAVEEQYPKEDVHYEAGTMEYLPKPFFEPMWAEAKARRADGHIEIYDVAKELGAAGTPVALTYDRTGEVTLDTRPIALPFRPEWIITDEAGSVLSAQPTGIGLTQVFAPPGTRVFLELGPLKGEREGWLLSVLGALGVFALMIWRRRRSSIA